MHQPSPTETLSSVLAARLAAGHWVEVVRLASRAVGAVSRQPEPWVWMALAYLRLGQGACAKACTERAIDQGGSPVVLAQLAPLLTHLAAQTALPVVSFPQHATREPLEWFGRFIKQGSIERGPHVRLEGAALWVRRFESTGRIFAV